MHKTMWIGLLCFGASVAIGACGSSGNGTTGTQGTGDTGSGGNSSTSSSSTSGTTSSTTGTSSTTSSTSSSSGAGGAACSGSTPVALTVLNFDSWCSVAIAGGTPSADPTITACVADGDVSLVATANTGFVLGDWYGTTNDTGSGDPGMVSGSGSSATSTAMVDATGTKACVSVCCPFAPPTPGGCPGSNQCP